MHDAHDPSVKTGFEKDLQGRLAARSIEKSPRLARPSHDKRIENKPVSHDKIKIPVIALPEDRPVAQAVSVNKEKPVAKENKRYRSGPGMIKDIKPLRPEGAPVTSIDNAIMPAPAKTEESPVIDIGIPARQISIKTEESTAQDKKMAEPEISDIRSLVKSNESQTIEKQKVVETIKTEDKAIHKETKRTKPPESQIKKDHNDEKPELPAAKRMEKAIAWTEKAAIPAPQKPIETPIEKTKQPITPE